MKKEIKKGYNEPNQTDNDISSELIKALEKLFLDVEGGRNKNPNNEEIKIKRAMKELIEILSKDINSFDVNGFLKKLEDYLAEYKRLLYSEVSVYIYAISSTTEKKRLNVLENMNNTFNYQLKKDEKIESALTKVVIKLWDHINLAVNQYNELKINDESFQKRIQPVIDQINENKKELQDSKKELYSQLIGIVSIFVAISFVMFGGMSLLNNLFDYSEMKSIPLLEMICGGSLIGIVMVIAVYVFILFMLRITGNIEEGKQPYKKAVLGACVPLGILCFATLVLWFCNIRDIDDVKRINTQCKVIEQDDKNVTMECPLDKDETNKSEANQVESSKDESDKSEVNKIESNKDKVK